MLFCFLITSCYKSLLKSKFLINFFLKGDFILSITLDLEIIINVIKKEFQLYIGVAINIAI